MATLSRRSSYFELSRSPRYSVLFALPLLVAYELLAAALAQPGRELRNGADVMLREAFTAVAGQRGPAIFMAAVVVLGLFLVVRDLRANKAPLRARVFGRPERTLLDRVAVPPRGRLLDYGCGSGRFAARMR